MQKGRASEKSYETAVVAIPPPDVWEPIQRCRRRWDRHLHRWMPHVTLVYPFLPHDRLDEGHSLLVEACASIDCFHVEIRGARHFSHGRGSFTLWLAPEPPDPWIALQAALQARFPDCDDVTRYAHGYVPHLSIGQARGDRELAERLGTLEDEWSPLEFEVAEVALIARHGDSPFRVDRTAPLRGGHA